MTYMQKIDTSAMMRELTEHETTQVSGGFGESDYTIDLPNTAIPAGFTSNDITSSEVIFDPNTNQLTTIFNFGGSGSYDLQGATITGDGSYAGARPIQTRSTTPVPANGGTTTTTTFNFQAFGVKFSITRQVVTVLPPATQPPASGCNNGGNRGGGGCIRPH
jgi:hypothetical protein